MNRNRRQLLAIPTIFLIGCASNPDVSFNYYLAKTDVNVKATQTVTCDEREKIFVASSAEVSPYHFADTVDRGLEKALKSFNLSDLSGSFANTDITVNMYDDGRLKGINSTSTGQGETIISSAIKAASFVFGGGIGVFNNTPNGATFNPACTFINGGNDVRDKTVSITFEGRLDLQSKTGKILPVADESYEIYSRLEPYIGQVYYELGELSVPKGPVKLNNATSGSARIDMRNPGLQSISIYSKLNDRRGNTIWADRVSVAQLGTAYQIPITKAKVFGKQAFSLEVASSGSVTKISYGNEPGFSQALNSVGNVASGLSGSTTAEKAAALKSEADLILQQQRLVRCQADPISCN